MVEQESTSRRADEASGGRKGGSLSWFMPSNRTKSSTIHSHIIISHTKAAFERMEFLHAVLSIDLKYTMNIKYSLRPPQPSLTGLHVRYVDLDAKAY